MSAVVLASASKRRQVLLAQIGVPVRVEPAHIDESRLPDEAAPDFVTRLAMEKASVVRDRHPASIVLGADTAVVLKQDILGKPADQQAAISMLQALSGGVHQVLTGIAVLSPGFQEARVVTTEVAFRDLSAPEIAAYVDTGEPLDKAGSYGIQGLGALFVRAISGSYSNVVGLPLCETGELLRQVGLPATEFFTKGAADCANL